MTRVLIGTALWGETPIDMLDLHSLWRTAKRGQARTLVIVQVFDTVARKMRVYAMDVRKLNERTFAGLVSDDAVPSSSSPVKGV